MLQTWGGGEMSLAYCLGISSYQWRGEAMPETIILLNL